MSRAKTPEGQAPQPISCANCIGACCRDTRFSNISWRDIQLIAGDRVPEEAASHEELAEVFDLIQQAPLPSGLIYKGNGNGTFDAVSIGKCSNLQQDNTCGIYPIRPKACKNLSMGGQDCQDARRAHGLDKSPQAGRRLLFFGKPG